MVQIDIDSFVKVRAMPEWLYKVLPDRNIIDRRMIKSVMIHARKKKLELDYANININSKKNKTTYITSYQDTANNYYKCKLIRL